ncbi:N-acetyltransferase [Shouchella miscanthi]|uniref:N-acetyltransferase n=1 Tax=Shouchella miscanthi TaxID=2598861 RepID=A0ABU6NMK6_9BACI|nr:N-acetyltransferase [Shouchella miscanthi]
MIHILKKPQLTEVAAFISNLNSLPEHHVGFCGKKKEEILHTLEEDFGDIPAVDAFVLAIGDEKTVGVCGFDADIQRGSAEIWGPFVNAKQAAKVIELLWTSLLLEMPKSIKTVELFPEKKNTGVLTFAKEFDFSNGSDQTILTCFNHTFMHKKVKSDAIASIQTNEYNQLIHLHDHLFPKTYLSGNEMIDQLGEASHVFIASDEAGRVTGYVHVEASPDFGEGSIEFLGVDTNSREKGLGTALLSKGLEWLFSFESIDEITLCVNSANETAIHIYQKLGFHKEHELLSYEKHLS